MTTLKIIEGAKEKIYQLNYEEYGDSGQNQLYGNLLVAMVIQILQSEIKRKKERTRKEYYSDRGFHEMNGFNKALEEDIAHLQVLLDSLK